MFAPFVVVVLFLLFLLVCSVFLGVNCVNSQSSRKSRRRSKAPTATSLNPVGGPHGRRTYSRTSSRRSSKHAVHRENSSASSSLTSVHHAHFDGHREVPSSSSSPLQHQHYARLPEDAFLRNSTINSANDGAGRISGNCSNRVSGSGTSSPSFSSSSDRHHRASVSGLPPSRPRTAARALVAAAQVARRVAEDFSFAALDAQEGGGEAQPDVAEFRVEFDQAARVIQQALANLQSLLPENKLCEAVQVAGQAVVQTGLQVFREVESVAGSAKQLEAFHQTLADDGAQLATSVRDLLLSSQSNNRQTLGRRKHTQQ